MSSLVVETKEESAAARKDADLKDGKKGKGKGYYLQDKLGFVTPLVWPNIVMIFALHLFALYGLLMFPYIYKLKTFCFGKLTFRFFELKTVRPICKEVSNSRGARIGNILEMFAQ